MAEPRVIHRGASRQRRGAELLNDVGHSLDLHNFGRPEPRGRLHVIAID
jgi:hypothetical protein